MSTSAESPAGPRWDFPARWGLLESFLNSVDVEAGQDDLTDVAGFSRWLREHDRAEAAAGVTEADLHRARQLREQLRQVLRHHHGEQLDVDAPALNRLAESLEVRVVFDETGGTVLQHRGRGATAFLAEIVVTVARADADGEWRRVKLCGADECAVAFYDTSKNRSKRWCSMKGCGNRQKTRSYYRRHQGQSAATVPE